MLHGLQQDYANHIIDIQCPVAHANESLFMKPS
ncbi:hypothetical protein MARI_18230 [Marinobacter sp. JH2]|nr:hypothetical protein MARI_18230 [Marinobacter sp. JH2]